MYAWLCLIWFISSLPGDSLPQTDAFNIDKLAHVSMYLILSLLVFANFRHGFNQKASKYSLLLGLIVLASFDEAHQLFITNRAVSALDLSANLFGIFLGYFILKSGKKKKT